MSGRVFGAVLGGLLGWVIGLMGLCWRSEVDGWCSVPAALPAAAGWVVGVAVFADLRQLTSHQ